MRRPMARSGRRTTSRRPVRDYVFVAVLAVALLAALAYALGDDDAVTAGEAVPVEGITHIHGLQVNPARPNELLVATHHGLVRGTDDAVWERVGPVQDYMGFTVHPREGDVYFASGHPPLGGNLGVIRSVDAGSTWQRVALEGVDFHAMAISAADPDHLWGYHAGRLYRSDDGGHAWAFVNEQAPRIASLAADPQDPLTLYASTDAGIARSIDGGASFEILATLPAFGLAAHPDDAGTLFAAAQSGIHRSDDGGATWTQLAPAMAGERPAYVAVDPTEPATLYVATLENGIHKSTDGGATWRAVRTPGAS